MNKLKILVLSCMTVLILCMPAEGRYRSGWRQANVDSLKFKEQASAPSTPVSGINLIYVDSSSVLRYLSSAGTDSAILHSGTNTASPTFTDLTLTGDLDLAGSTHIISRSGTDHIDFQSGYFRAAGVTGWNLMIEAVSGVNPVINPRHADFDTGIGSNAADQLSLIAGAVEMWRYVEDTTDYSYTLFPMLIGTSTILTGTNTYTLAFGDNVSFPTLSANQAALYNKSGELFAIDEDENEAQLTGNTNDYPSDMTVSINYPYVNPRSQHYVGIKTYISEHKAFELLQDLLRNQGILQANEFIIKHESFAPIINWADNQEASRLRREQEIQDAQDKIAQLDVEIAVETKPDKLAELQEQKLKIKIPGSYVKRNPDSQWLISKGVKLKP